MSPDRQRQVGGAYVIVGFDLCALKFAKRFITRTSGWHRAEQGYLTRRSRGVAPRWSGLTLRRSFWHSQRGREAWGPLSTSTLKS